MKNVRNTIFAALIFLLLPQLAWAAPVINSITPLKHLPGTLDVTINGSQFTGANEILIFDANNGVQVESPVFTIKSDTQIATNANLQAGTYFLRVKTPQGTSNNSPNLAVGSAPPIISAISPMTTAPTLPAGTPSIVLTGENFTGVKFVRVYNSVTGKLITGAYYTVNSNYQITAAAKLGVGSYFIKVITAFGTSNNSMVYTVGPSVSSSLSLVKINNVDRLRLTITLDSPAKHVTSVEYKVISGQSSTVFNDANQGTTISSGILTFNVGNLTKMCSIPFRVDIDKAIMVTLSNPVNVQFESPSVSENMDRKVLVNVKSAVFNAAGDGVTIDKVGVQAAITCVMNNGGGIVYFPKGTYLVYEIGLPANISLIGEGNRESILKAPDHVNAIINPKFFWRMFRTGTTGWARYEGYKDSAPLLFQNLIIDYNGPNQTGWDDGINAEQNYCIELAASTKKPGRLKVVFDNCEISHSVSDGISVIQNVNCTVTNCLFKTNRRGSIDLLGGHSITQAKNITVMEDLGPSIALQSEVCELGYGGTRRSDFYLNDSYIEGEIDIGMEPYLLKGGDGTIISMKNVDASKGCYRFSGHGATYLVENSKLGNMGGWWLMPQKATFTNCEFISRQKPDGTFPEACVRIMWNQGPTAWKNQVLTFNNCTFTAEDAVLGYSGPTAAINVVLFEKFSNNNKLVVNGGKVTDRLKHVITSNYGGMATMEFKNLEINTGDTAFKLAGASGDGRYNITFDNLNILNGKFARLYPSHPDCIINYNNLFMDQEVNWISSLNYSMYVTVQGTRTVLGDNPPTVATHGLVGDVYQLKSDPTQKWLCTNSGFWADYGAGALEPAVWTAQ